MADPNADKWQVAGAELATNPDAVNISTGLTATEADGVVTVTVAAGGISATQLASDAVTTAKILNLNVTTAKIAADAIDATKIADAAVSLEHLDTGIAPAYVVKYAGQHTTAGGDAAETATVTGAAATDIAIASIEDNGTNNVTLLQTAAASNAVNFTLSADPGTDCIINYLVLRAAS